VRNQRGSNPGCVDALSERGQLPRFLAQVHLRFSTPVIAIAGYSAVYLIIALLGSLRLLAIISPSATLMFHIACCLGLLRLRARDVARAGDPFRAPGGAFVPLAAAADALVAVDTRTERDRGRAPHAFRPGGQVRYPAYPAKPRLLLGTTSYKGTPSAPAPSPL